MSSAEKLLRKDKNYEVEDARSLRYWLIGAFVITLLSAIAFTICCAVLTPRLRVNAGEDFSDVDLLTGDYLPVYISHTYEIAWVVVAFAWVAVIYYGIAAFVHSPRKFHILTHMQYRWVAYSIMGALSAWIIATFAGASNILLLSVVSIVCALDSFSAGWIHDETNWENIEFPKSRVMWRSFSLGAVMYLLFAAVVLDYFVKLALSGPVNWTVWVIVIGGLVAELLVGIIQLIRWTNKKPNHFSFEKAFIVVNVISVLALSWFFIGRTVV